MSTCSLCGTTAMENASYCSQCGKLLGEITPSSSATKPKWYYNIWFVLFMLFFVVGPFGLPLVWKNPRFARWVKVGLTLVMVVYTIGLIGVTIRTARAVMDQMNQFNATMKF